MRSFPITSSTRFLETERRGQPRIPLHWKFKDQRARVPAFPVALHGTTHEPQQHRLHRKRSQCETGPFQDVGEELALPGRAARMISRWRPASVCLCRSWPRGIEPAHRTASQVSPWPQQRGSSSRDRPAAKDRSESRGACTQGLGGWPTIERDEALLFSTHSSACTTGA